MSNRFKTNSRFSSLLEENKNEHKNKRNENIYNKRYDNDDLKKRRQLEEPINQDININNFPELILIKNNKTLSTEMNYMNVIKKVETKCNKEQIISRPNFDKQYINLQPGWNLLKKDLKTIIIDISREENLTCENKVAYEVFEKLAKLHEKRSKEYIELWGYDEWEKMFRFSNYDYEYFNKLDEQYTQEIEEVELEYTDSDTDLN